jgi:hypothetical protein
LIIADRLLAADLNSGFKYPVYNADNTPTVIIATAILPDDFGLQALDSQNRITLLEIIEDWHNKGSIIATSQIPVQG